MGEVLVAQLCLTLFDPMDCSPPGSSVHGIFQARILEWVAIPSPGDLPNPGIEPTSLACPALAGGLFTTSTAWEASWGEKCIQSKQDSGTQQGSLTCN